MRRGSPARPTARRGTPFSGGRLTAARALTYNDLSADRNCVAVVQAMEAILAAHAAGSPGGVVQVNAAAGGLSLYLPGVAEPRILYAPPV